MAPEAQPNRPLSGSELKQIIMNDVESVLAQDGMLAPHIAFTRVAYSVTVKVMTGNPMMPSWKNRTTSKQSTKQQVEGKQELVAMNQFPLKPVDGEDTLNIGLERKREIISPNHSRIENGMPITITSRGQDGDVKEEKIHYETDLLPDDGEFADKVTGRELSETEIIAKDED